MRRISRKCVRLEQASHLEESQIVMMVMIVMIVMTVMIVIMMIVLALVAASKSSNQRDGAA